MQNSTQQDICNREHGRRSKFWQAQVGGDDKINHKNMKRVGGFLSVFHSQIELDIEVQSRVARAKRGVGMSEQVVGSREGLPGSG